MNDISSGLDPDLVRLFDEAPAVDRHDEAFVGAMLVKLHRARRRRLLARLLATSAIVVLGALLAPYVAQATLTVAGWVTLYYPVGYTCAALIAWRIARRQFN
jgi:peptidoglycan/LPS O-acetylase OafA/YrhL